jgi:hypothetical protein
VKNGEVRKNERSEKRNRMFEKSDGRNCAEFDSEIILKMKNNE